MSMPSTSDAATGDAVIALKLKGAGFDQIADALGLPSARTARKQMIRALARRSWENTTSRDTLRAEQTARLETLMAAAWEKALDAEDPEQLTAIRTVRDLIDRIIRLHGLDAPTELTIYNPSAMELQSWVAQTLSGRTSQYAALEASVVDDDIDDIEPVPATIGSREDD